MTRSERFFVLIITLSFGIMFLSTLMGYEGNYIGRTDEPQGIYLPLLRAKYILYSIALLIPTILMIPGMVTEGIRTRLYRMADDIHSGSRILLSVPTGSLQQQDYRPEFKDDQPAEYRHGQNQRCRYTFTAAFLH